MSPETKDEKYGPQNRLGRRYRRIALTLIPMMLMLAAAAHAETLTYRDKLDRTVHITLPVRKAVFFQTYEFIPALGAWDRVAGVGRFAYTNDLIRAAKPDIARTVPSTGSGTDINIEALLKLRPDVVVTWAFKPENVRFMESKGLAVIAIYPESIAELYGVMDLLGRMLGKEKETKRTKANMEELFDTVRKRTARIPADKRQKVLWIGSRPHAVAGGIGATNELIAMIGGVNPAAEIAQRNADVSIERIIRWNPDVVFIWGNAKYGTRDILRNPQWRAVAAVRNGRVYKAPEWSTWSPRLAPVALWMAMKTYPEYYRDVRYAAAADSFYRKTFGIPYRMVSPVEN